MANGLLIVNLGSPASPSTKDVRSYLKEFLSDQNVITMPKIFWQPILRGFILPLRSWRSATFYKHSWTKAGSPLIAYTQITRDRLQEILPNWDVQMAMNYGGQFEIETTLKKMKANGDTQIVVISLFPNYTQSTTKTIIDKVNASGVKAYIIRDFYKLPKFSELQARNIDQAYQKGDFDKVIISYHGIPSAMVRNGDPYKDETEETTSLIKSKLKIVPKEDVEMCYQSKFGPAPWLKPYLKNRLMELAQLGKRNVLVAMPSFVTDCLETLEENNVQNYQSFRENGGNKFETVRPFNGDPEFCQMLADMAVTKIKSEEK